MFNLVIIVVVIGAVFLAAIIVVLCCFGVCRRRKSEDDDNGVTRVFFYPETDPYDTTHETSNEPYSEHANANTAAHSLPSRHRYHYYYIDSNERPVTAAVAGSGPCRPGAEPPAGTVVRYQETRHYDAGVREPVIYGEAVYYSRPANSETTPSRP